MALRLVGEPAAVKEHYADAHNNCVHVCFLWEMLHSLPAIARLLLLPEGVLMLDTLHSYSPASLPVTVSV